MTYFDKSRSIGRLSAVLVFLSAKFIKQVLIYSIDNYYSMQSKLNIIKSHMIKVNLIVGFRFNINRIYGNIGVD